MLSDYAMELYVYCTDFIINVSDILGISYYEVNFWIFCVLYPVLLIGSIGLFTFQNIRLKKLKKSHTV